MQWGELIGNRSISSPSSSVISTIGIGAGKVKDRPFIAEFTNEDVEEIDGFPVNSLDSMVQDQSVNIGQILLAAYVTRSINENDLGKLWTASCTIHSSLFRISARRKFRTKRFIQQKVMEAIIDAEIADGGHIT